MLAPLLRSKKMMIILAVVVAVALVLTGGIGLFQALATNPVASPPPAQDGQGQGEAPDPLEAPEIDVLGQAPSGLTYDSDEEEDVHCNPAECVRLVQVLPEDEGSEVDSEEAVEQVYGHLLDQNWGQLLPEGVEEPDDVPMSETIMTDGDVLVADSSEHGGSDSVAVLMLGNANQPAS